jgi:hypothetical protein
MTRRALSRACSSLIEAKPKAALGSVVHIERSKLPTDASFSSSSAAAAAVSAATGAGGGTTKSSSVAIVRGVVSMVVPTTDFARLACGNGDADASPTHVLMPVDNSFTEDSSSSSSSSPSSTNGVGSESRLVCLRHFEDNDNNKHATASVAASGRKPSTTNEQKVAVMGGFGEQLIELDPFLSAAVGAEGLFSLPALHEITSPVEHHFKECAVCYERKEFKVKTLFTAESSAFKSKTFITCLGLLPCEHTLVSPHKVFTKPLYLSFFHRSQGERFVRRVLFQHFSCDG